jgi:hypothetical protein
MLQVITNRSESRIAAIYEVKTDCDTQSIYTAIGQLMFHGVHDTISKTLVLPSENDDKHRRVTLKNLRIALLEYEIRNGEVIFMGLVPHALYARR